MPSTSIPTAVETPPPLVLVTSIEPLLVNVPFNALPMFHAFGVIATLLPLMYGVRNFLYPSPLHYKLVPETVYAEQSTIMFGTDTFLTGYARKGNPLDFQSLRYVFAGGEAVRAETRDAYMRHFKKPIFEGYGVTCGLTFTFGGLRITTGGEVVNLDFRPIPGLFAAGELVGGLFYFNYPGGSGLTSGAVFGRIAGASAARAAKTSAGA